MKASHIFRALFIASIPTLFMAVALDLDNIIVTSIVTIFFSLFLWALATDFERGNL